MTTKDNIESLWKYHNYVRTKDKPRNNETQEAIIDCIKILQGRFSEIRKRDKLYEETDRNLRNLAKKTKKKK